MDNAIKKTQDVILKLRQERELRHISQLELSFSSGISQTMISHIESGRKIPTLRTLIRLCDALDINPAILFSFSDDEENRRRVKHQIITMIERYL